MADRLQCLPGRTLLEEQDFYYFNEGTSFRMGEKFGGRLGTCDGVSGAYFSVWAPNASEVAVVGGFNGWDGVSHHLAPWGNTGVWTGFIPGLERGTLYKFRMTSRDTGIVHEKADPLALSAEIAPKTASVLWDLEYDWSDQEWMRIRRERNSLKAPISIYEVHLGSWKRKVEPPHHSLNYRELARELVEHLIHTGFTHVELLPITEHPFFGSWGYQAVGFFAPTSRYGTPQDFMYFVDYLHQHGIGVILDWVPSHFPTDIHGLSAFDGTHLYEHADARQGFHPDWNSLIFNYGRNEVRAFLLSSAGFWLSQYHIDGLRVDAVASMLYLDYSRKEGEWIPNKHGGRENLEAIDFLRTLNTLVYSEHPDVITIAEESTSWPMVSRPVYLGGLGFGLKWDMGWMHDALEYMKLDPIHRKWHQRDLTFRYLYAFSENFVLSLSHDEVVHMKGSLLNKMSGDYWQKLANLRLLYGSMWAQPGKKLLFMGQEFAQHDEWNHDAALPWHLLNVNSHQGVLQWIRDLNQVYRWEPALFEMDFDQAGFEWIDCDDAESSTLSFLRWSAGRKRHVVVVCNFTPVPRMDFRVGVPESGAYREILNSDGAQYGGSGIVNSGRIEAVPYGWQGRPCSLEIALPPLGCVFLGRLE